MSVRIDYGYLKQLQDKVESFGSYLADDSASYCRKTYDNNKVYVAADCTEKGFTITAKGFEMPFEEYGAGALAITDVVGGVVVGEDTWSVEHKQEYHRWGLWKHNGKVYYYKRPKYAMHKTVERLQRDAVKNAMRYFK